ncbi:Protein of unknown function [Natronincola peptidivorans]|uniref:DUF2953 domain-containing protein n=1 Tax=Natronincola peptidivorans TaxID=426128 RepID=A0A1H9YNT2_9FIRM|nr:DUF2953 domain-containing protein [Natronincola peptidivorans]SES70152.1 Protein of unknown function [Natronincola peptidivorans]
MQTYYYLVGISIFSVCLFIALLFISITIDIKILREGENDEVIIVLSVLNGFFKYKIDIPFLDMVHTGNNLIRAKIHNDTEVGNKKEQINDSWEEELNFNEIKIIFEEIQSFKKKYWNVIEYIKGKLRIKKVLWYTKIGLEDAAITAIVTGIIWVIKTNIILFIRNTLNLEDISIDVVPNYMSKKFALTFHCIVGLKIGYIIIASIKLLMMKFRGGEKIERASN